MKTLITNYYDYHYHPVFKNLCHLSVLERKVIIGCMLSEDYDYIAEMVGIKKGYVHTLKKTAIKKLKDFVAVS